MFFNIMSWKLDGYSIKQCWFLQTQFWCFSWVFLISSRLIVANTFHIWCWVRLRTMTIILQFIFIIHETFAFFAQKDLQRDLPGIFFIDARSTQTSVFLSLAIFLGLQRGWAVTAENFFSVSNGSNI